MSKVTSTVRYTATLPSDYINELKELAQAQQIPSVNFAIKQALEEYLRQVKKREFDELMKEAAVDQSFLQRTMNCEGDFAFLDSEVHGEW